MARQRLGDAARVHDLLERLTSLFRGELRAVASAHDLKIVQLEALIYLSRANRYSDSSAALGEYLALTKGTVSQTLAALQKKKLIEKRTDTNDARVLHCALTKSAEAIVSDAYPTAALESLEPKRLANTAQELQFILRDLQRSQKNRSFGQCHSCRFHEKRARTTVCGLTQETLTSHDALKICREHEAA